MKKGILLILAIWLLTACLDAQEPVNPIIKETITKKVLSEYEECMQMGPPNECIMREIDIRDKELNIAYKKAKKAIPSRSLKELKKIQREWIVYRDMRCGFYYDAESGSGGLTDSMLCQLEETIKRTDELKELY